MRTCSLSIATEADLAPLARALAAALPFRACVALTGDLGAGKTTFVKAFAAAVGIDPTEVVSPTFGLVHEHPSPTGILLHADMYRLAGADDLHELGWDDAVARARCLRLPLAINGSTTFGKTGKPLDLPIKMLRILAKHPI